MALDGIYLYSLIKHISDFLLDAKVDKINQPEKDEIVITFRKDRANKKLLISASSSYPRIHFTDQSKPNPLKAPMFCMLLRKYLSSARVKDIKQIDCDRIIVIDFESTDEMGFDSIYSLIVEIMGRHSNITLVRKRDNIIMDSIKHITPDINSYRCIYPGIEYVSPPASNKLNPFNFSKEVFFNFIKDNHLVLNENTASSIFTGVSKLLSREIYENYKINFSEITFNDSFYDFCKDFFYTIKKGDFTFQSYSESSTKLKDFYNINLKTMDKYIVKHYDDPSSLLEDFYYEKDKQDRLHAKSLDLQKVIHNNLDRCEKKINILKNTIKECANKDSYRIKGELLTANIYKINKGDSTINVLNYYSDKEEYIDIILDENKSPSENIQSFYKKYNKYKKSEEAANEQLKIAEEEISYLNSVLSNIINADSYAEIEEIRLELAETGYIKHSKNKSKSQKPSKPLHFLSSDGIDIFVGKNNIQNDYLTLKFADKQDTWLHIKNSPGSHVIIKSKSVSDTALMEAANLAAYYSKSRNSSNIPIDYTEVKNVRKPAGAKPGMVIYYTNKTIYVTPKEPELKKI